jgi:hypothetical protein
MAAAIIASASAKRQGCFAIRFRVILPSAAQRVSRRAGALAEFSVFGFQFSAFDIPAN